jgi:alkylation response protein AidB-like acyl-CoA dehydrogenase
VDFNLSPENKMVVKAASDFCKKEIEPIQESILEHNDYPDDLIKKFAKARMLGMAVPREYGGAGSTHLNFILITEELGKTGTACAFPFILNNAAAEMIYHWGSENLRKKFVPALCDGSAYGTIAFTEPATGSDPTALSTTATLDGNRFIVNGRKRYITSGNKRGYGIFYVRDQGLRGERDDVTALILDKTSEGYSTSVPWGLMGLEGINCVDVNLKDVIVPKDHVLGERGKGFRILLYWAGSEKIQQMAYLVGIGQAALEEGVKYSKERIVKGKPIGNMQGIQWMLADMKTRVDACRYLTYRAGCVQDAGGHVDVLSAELKIFVVPMIQEVARLSLQIHGSYGYSKEYKIERLFRCAAHGGVVGTSCELNRSIAGAAIAMR